MIRLSFDRKFVPLVAPFAAKHDIRYYLNGIRVESATDRPGVYIVGCDGHRLTIAYDKDGRIEGDDGKGVIMRAHKAFISACKARSPVPLKVLVEGERVSVGVEGGVAHNPLETYVMPGNPWLEGKYPDIHRILPCWENLKPGFASPVSPQYLADYMILAGDRKSYDGLVFWQETPESPIVVQHTAQPEIVSILMPRRVDALEREQYRNRLARVAAGKQKEAV